MAPPRLRSPLTIPDLDVEVDCNGNPHVMRVRRGLPRAESHSAEERALVALGGDPPKCHQIVSAVKHNYPQLRLAPGTFPWPAQVSGNRSRRLQFPRSIRPTDVPQILRRIAVLRHLRADSLKKDDPKAHIRAITESFVKRLLDTVGVDTFSRGSRVKVSTGPGRTGVSFHSEWVHLHLSPEWLQTVYLLGLELFDSKLTLAMTETEDSMTLHQISTQSFTEFRRRLPKSAIKGIRRPD